MRTVVKNKHMGTEVPEQYFIYETITSKLSSEECLQTIQLRIFDVPSCCLEGND
jgi:hypothetical protein